MDSLTLTHNDYSPQQAAPPPLPPSAYPPPLPMQSRFSHTPQLSPATSSFASTSSDYDPHEVIGPSSPIITPSYLSHPTIASNGLHHLHHQHNNSSAYPHTPQHKLAQRLESTTLSDSHSPKHLLINLPTNNNNNTNNEFFTSAAAAHAGIMASKPPLRSPYPSLPPVAAPLSFISPPHAPPSPASSDHGIFATDEDLLPNGMTFPGHGSPMGPIESPEPNSFTSSWFSHDSHPSVPHLSTHHLVSVSAPTDLDDYLHSPNAPQPPAMQSNTGAFRSGLGWLAQQQQESGVMMSRSASGYFVNPTTTNATGGGHPMLATMSMPNSFSNQFQHVNPAAIQPGSSVESTGPHTGHTSLFHFGDDEENLTSPVQPLDTTSTATAVTSPFTNDTIRASQALRTATTNGCMSGGNGNGVGVGGMVDDTTVRGQMFTSPIRPIRPPLSHDLFQSSAPGSLQSRSWSPMMTPNGLLPSPGMSPFSQMQYGHQLQLGVGQGTGSGSGSGDLTLKTNKQPFRYKGKIPNWEELPTKRSRGRRPHQTNQGGVVRPQKLTKTGKPSTIYVCKVPACNGQVFQRSEHLKRHIASIHMDHKPHGCPAPGCDKKFSRKDNLRQHMKVHKDLPLRPSLSMSRTSSSTSNASFGGLATSSQDMLVTGSSTGGIGAGLKAMNIFSRAGTESTTGSEREGSEEYDGGEDEMELEMGDGEDGEGDEEDGDEEEGSDRSAREET